ncbi:glycosyltransferase [Patescibacteria group bacterium]
MPRIKILFAITSLYPGGAENHTMNLVSRLSQRQFEPMIVATNQGGALEKQIKAQGIPYRILKKRTKLGHEVIKELKSIYQEFQPDIIHTQLFSADYLARTAAKSYPRAKIVTTIQNIEEDLSLVKTRINKRLAKRTDKFIAITEAVKKFALEKFDYPAKQISVINNTVDLSDFLYKARPAKSPDSRILIGSVGRLVPQKGMDTLIKAFKNALVTSKKDLQLNIIGDGELRPELEKLARELEVDEQVKFWGNQDDISAILHRLDIFALISNWEGLGNVFMEAMASGLPIVASEIGGIPEIVKAKRNGLLVKPDDVEATRRSLLKLIDDQRLYEAMSEANFKDAQKRFDPKISVKKHEELYLNLVK